MKIKILALALALATCMASQAQPGGGRGADPVQRAERQTQMMIDSLSLSKKQGEKVKEINLKYAEKQKVARDANTDGNWEKMRPVMDSLRNAQNAELKGVLTSDQYERWQKIAEQQWQRRGPGAPGGGPGEKGQGRGGNQSAQAPPPPPPNNGGSPAPPPPPPAPAPPPVPEKGGGNN